MQIDSFNNQRIAFPVSYRVAEPALVLSGSMRVTKRDNARIIDHFNEDHYIIIGLHYLVHVVVENIIHRRTTGAAKADNAAPLMRVPLGHHCPKIVPDSRVE